MRTLTLALLAGLAACSEGAATATLPLPEGARLVVVAAATDVEIGNGGAGAIEVAGGDDPEALVTLARGTARVEVPAGLAKVVIRAPAGSDLVAATASGALTVRGRWGRVDLKTADGGLLADVDAVASGRLLSTTGDVRLRAAHAPEEDLRCESVGGDARVTMPSDFRGRVHATTQTGKIEIGEHPSLRTQIEPSGKAALAFAGEMMTEEERAAELAERGSPRAIWISSGRGTAAFALAD